MAPAKLLIRQSRPTDKEAIKELTLAAYGEFAERIQPHWIAYRENILSTLTQYEPAAQFAAELGGELVGSVLLYPAEGNSAPEVRLLAVRPDRHRQGIGAALMQACIRQASQSRAETLALHTLDLMESAVRLYEQLGFVRAESLDWDPAPGLTIKGFTLDLTRISS